MKLTYLRDLVQAELRRLERLGSANAIAEELSSRGITGKLHDVCDCALARALCDTLLIDSGRVRVGQHDVFVLIGMEGVESLAHLGDVAKDFVRAFDREAFPHLIAVS